MSKYKEFPKVSVIITCFKYSKYLPYAVRSVINQTFKDWEIIIVNDCSPDNTLAVAKRLINRYPNRKISLINNNRNKGLGESRNIAIRTAKGKYILPLDADDRFKNTCLAEMVRVLDKGVFGLVYSKVKYFGSSNNIKGECRLFNYEEFRKGNMITAMAMFRRCDWGKVGGYKTFRIMGWEDYEFYIRLIRSGVKPYFIPRVLCFYRQHDSNMIQNHTNKNFELASSEVFAHHIDWAIELPAYLRIANINRHVRNFHKAESYYKKVLMVDKNHFFALYNLGSIFEDKGRFNDAINYFKKAHECSYGYTNDLSGLNFHLGKIYFYRQKKLIAKKYLRKALICNRNHKEAKRLLKSIK